MSSTSFSVRVTLRSIRRKTNPTLSTWRVIYLWKSFLSYPSKCRTNPFFETNSDGLWLVDNHSYTACTSSFIPSTFSYLMVISGLMKYELLAPCIATGVTTNLTTLQDAVSNLERVCNTPLPFAYQVHLRMTVSYVPLRIFAWGTFLNASTFLGYISCSCLYAIPSFRFYYVFLLNHVQFQIAPLQYINIPATAFTAFLLLGFLEIGQEMWAVLILVLKLCFSKHVYPVRTPSTTT